ncbi:ribonuclease H-like domain-containing protein [Rodentibacter caecimuris]|uniref:ribonuclease H-like domain-containing protein n=1 Tax=Rodentibacter caecimuris TaxID=1796644 RepID=UPI002248E121|nr:ribonuclease H-like domain-containing protein [Rodentibacter heylii]MCX2962454.1 ribonuclease H-like domain-containing protein [Rodentibacter heylii]
MNIYLDIETIPTQNKQHQTYVCENLKAPANYKNAETIEKWLTENQAEAVHKTALDGTFGEIAVIGVAINDEPVVTFYREDWQLPDRESDILSRFNAYLKEMANKAKTVPLFIGHNLSKFDGLFLQQRHIINGIKPYYCLDKRNTYDTMLEWCGYDKNKYPSLDKLCQVLGIEQKGEIDGSKVWEYVQVGRINEVAAYCAKDVERVRQVYKRMNFME